MGTNRLRTLVGALVLLGMAFFAFTWQLREGQVALRLRLGRSVGVIEDAGLHLRLPWPIDKVVTLDARQRVLNTRHTEMLTRDKKNVILLSYVIWRVQDPLRFYQSLGTIEAADSKLDGLVTNAKISVLGGYDLSALVSTTPEDLKVEEIERAILDDVSQKASEKYGVAIEEVGLKRLSLPEGNTRYVFEQMRAERKQYAARFRAEGEREAARIRADTDLEVAKIRAEASEQAATIRGEAEAEAARIYAEAHSVDPEFYKFTRSLESLQKVLGKKSTVVLRTDAAPFQVLESTR
ncbi:MAG: protease modulator HflC [Pseudomonadota bacterium]